MKDGIIKGTGNSRNLKSAIPADITHEQLVAMLIAGTFPIDLNGINPEGWQQIGDALCKGNLLDDVACDLLGISRKSVPKDAFIRLGMPTGYHAFGITVTVDGKPLPNVLIQGVKTFAGAQVYADGSGRAIGMSTSDTVTITIDGFLDLQPYTKRFSASPETVITKINIEILKKDTTRVLIDTSQTLLVSRFVDTYDLFLVGGGGSGGMLATRNTYNGVGGGGSGYTTTKRYIYNHNDELEFSIGSGGRVSSGSGYIKQDGRSGGNTTVVNLETYKDYGASGGYGGKIGNDDRALGGNGGSGGGGVYSGGAGDGGSDGSEGGRFHGGNGQGNTTREFGETGGTLYAGAGGAVVWQTNDPDDQEEGSGGAGGGADGIGGENLSNERSVASFYGGGGGAIISSGGGSSLVTEGYQGCAVVRWRWV